MNLLRQLLAQEPHTKASEEVPEISHDIHQTTQAERLRSLVTKISEPFFGIEPDGTIFFFSEGAGAFLGLQPKMVEGRKFDAVLPLEPREQMRQALIALIERRIRLRVELLYKQMPVMMVISPLMSVESKLLGALIELKDLTDKKRLQQMQIDFVSFVSHELRTPISSIKGYLYVLQQEADYLTPEHKEFLQRAYLSNERQEKTVEKLLALSSLERGNIDVALEKVQPDEILSEVLEVWRPKAEAKNLRLVYNFPKFTISPVKSDKSLLRSVLDNLIENAIKYTAQGQIEISIMDQNSMVAIHVKDTGPGIEPEVQKRIFSKFVRGEHSLTERTQGSGLGLYLAKQFAGHMNGDITLQSELGKGSTFTITLPKFVDGH